MKMTSRRYFEIYCDDQHDRVPIGLLFSDKSTHYHWELYRGNERTEIQQVYEMAPSGVNTPRPRVVFRCTERGCKRRVPCRSLVVLNALANVIVKTTKEHSLSLKALPDAIGRYEQMIAERVLRAQAAIQPAFSEDALRKVWRESEAAKVLTERQRIDIWRRVMRPR